MGKRSDSRRFGSLAYGHLNGFEATHDRGATGISPAYENVAFPICEIGEPATGRVRPTSGAWSPAFRRLRERGSW